MQCFRAKVKYSDEMILSLCRTQYDVYYWHVKLLIMLIAVALMSAAVVAEIHSAFKIFMIIVGALMISFTNYVPKYKAKITISALKGNYPETMYCFRDGDVLLQAGQAQRSLDYSLIIHIQQDDNFIYLFVSKTRAYVLDKKQIKPDDPEGLLAFLAEKSGCRVFRSRGRRRLWKWSDW